VVDSASVSPGPRSPVLSPRFVCDTHTHTSRCGHAGGADETYVEAAIARGLDAIAVTDHLPSYWLPAEQCDPSIAMAAPELPRYVEAVLALQDRFRGRIEVLLGVEADYISGHEDQLAALLSSYPFDLVLGSVHRLGDWWADAPGSHARYAQGQAEIDRIWDDYAPRVIRAAGSGLFDVLSHLDLPKKFGHRPSRPFGGHEDELVAAVAASGCAVELSSAGRRKPVGEDYPAPALLARLASAGAPLVLSSDAHAPAEVGFAFPELVEEAKGAGFREVSVFRRRQRHATAL
jgi:histidinol-phosphatase (PHP family)